MRLDLHILFPLLLIIFTSCGEQKRAGDESPHQSEIKPLAQPQPFPQDRVWESEPVERGNVVRGPSSGLVIGFVTRSPTSPERLLNGEFGVEQWDRGKRATHRYQLWYLTGSHSVLGNSPPDVTVERLVINIFGAHLPKSLFASRRGTLCSA